MNALLPVRHPNKDFFVCDIFNAIPGFRDDMASMEHPIFSLSTKPDKRVLYYEHNGNSIKIIPSGLGLATIHDKDVLLYCISYLRAALKAGHDIQQRIRLTAHDLLVSTNRPTNDDGYRRLQWALERLSGTRIQTDIKTGGYEVVENFGLIDAWRIVRTHPKDGRMVAIEIKLSDWFFNALLADELLTINRDYFRLRKPLERRLYEIARKHCGEQKEWAIGLEKLKLKTGSMSSGRLFKHYVNKIVSAEREHKHFPDYTPVIHDNTMIFRNKRTRKTAPAAAGNIPALAPWAFEKARAAAPGWDVYYLEQEWRAWIEDKPSPEKGYEAAFIGFCKQKYRKQGQP